ncbi:hypothetical protein [Thalassotalea sp. ND16A]|uniref:hypothetical protein n=1 Tax=Thalassotalea sp. ND16A TaxID=1535422 RepID=UPI00051A3872|nr:hypothetical protein [Thalassotalea sp. ND16A]KGJ87997.1 hypothetical protein ND16A_2550 [Thalassotalea sp. ND16A]
MEISVNFKSDLFHPHLPDEAQVNPGVHGAELAWWLGKELAARDVVTSYPESEDWGWFIEYIIDDNVYSVCCGNVENRRNEWHIYLDPHAKSLFGRNKAKMEHANVLISTLKELLNETKEITNIEWNGVGA